MPFKNPHALVESNWLESHIDNPTIKILDASWHMPNLGRDAKAEYKESHILGATYFDIDSISDGSSELPHMLPSAETFSKIVGEMGIDNDTHVVIYDSYGLFSAARAWWMFRAFGHEKVSLLNGGTVKWIEENRPMTSNETKVDTASFKATFNPDMVKSIEDIQTNLETNDFQVIDARARDRFFGKVPEPRPGLRSGHIPNALNLPFNLLLEEDKTLKSNTDITGLYEGENLDFSKPVIASCGTGVTACALNLGLYLIGKEDVSVYDGSWTEWGGRQDTPIETE